VDSFVELLVNDQNPTVKKEASTALAKLATQEPLEFSVMIRDLTLDDEVLANILKIIEDVDPDVHKIIKEELENV